MTIIYNVLFTVLWTPVYEKEKPNLSLKLESARQIYDCSVMNKLIFYTAKPVVNPPIGCAPGSIANASGVCTPCPQGGYKMFWSSNYCVPCPEHHTTLSVGSTRLSDCQCMCRIPYNTKLICMLSILPQIICFCTFYN